MQYLADDLALMVTVSNGFLAAILRCCGFEVVPIESALESGLVDRRGGKIGRIRIDAGVNGVTKCQNFRRRLLRQTDLRLDVLCFRFHRCPFKYGGYPWLLCLRFRESYRTFPPQRTRSSRARALPILAVC